MGNGRDQQLDGLRAVAVLMVLYAHLFATESAHWGHIGVRLFFVLSGFLITRLLLEARHAERFEPAAALRSFYARRALRIFPIYFGMLGFVWLVNLEQSSGSMIWHALYLSNFWYALKNEWTPWLLCHTWSLSIEEQFYLIWPLVILLAPLQSIGRICIGAIAFSLAYRLCWPITGTPTLLRDLLPPASMDALVAGALLAVHRTGTSAWPRWIRLSWLPIAVAFLLLNWFRTVPLPPAQDWLRWIGLEILPVIPLVVIVGSFSAGSSGFLGRLMELRPLTALGRISYGVYLFHPIALSFSVKAQAWLPINVSEQGPGRFLVAGALTLVFASISWLVLEKRLNALKRYFPYVPARARNAAFANGAAARLHEAGGGGSPARLREPADHNKSLQTLDLRTDWGRNMSVPLVSVLLPVYNAESYLPAAVESILRQDHERLEVIAINDGSTDRSLEILQRYRKADDRISIISRENRGLIATLNEGLAVAKGDLIARMDADDIAYPSRLSRQVSLFARQPQLAICGTGIDRLIGDRVLLGSPNPIYRMADLGILSMFFTIFIHSTVVYNRKVIPDEMLVYDKAYPHAEDFDLFRRITDRFPAAMIDESLLAYRIHDNSVTAKHKRQMRQTHLKIVAENLGQACLIDDPAILHDIGERVTEETIGRVAEFLLALEEATSRLPAEARPSFEEGALCFFYFLYQMISDEERPWLTHEFLTRTQKWEVIRRRERYGLRAGVHAPWFSLLSAAATKRADAFARHLQSVPAATVLPSAT